MAERGRRGGTPTFGDAAASNGSRKLGDVGIVAPKPAGSHGRGEAIPTAAPATRVVIAAGDADLQHEILDFLDRDPHVEVVGVATDASAIAALVEGTEASAVLADATVAAELSSSPDGSPDVALLVATDELTVPVLRRAIEVGAAGAYSWPSERHELARALDGLADRARLAPAQHGRIVAVMGSRGGAGTTFVATHAAAAFADRELSTVLVDLDATFSDVTAALGVAADLETRTVEDLLVVAAQLSPDVLSDVVFHHERGFDVLLGPRRPLHDVPLGLYAGAVALFSTSYDCVVLHVARGPEPAARAALELAEQVFLVTPLDLFSLYGARRAIAALRLDEPEGRCRVVINRPARPMLRPTDAERVLGMPPAAAIRMDVAVRKAQARGELLGRRGGRAMRDVRALTKLVAPAASRRRDAR